MRIPIIHTDPPTFAIVSVLSAILVVVYLLVGLYWHAGAFVLVALGTRWRHKKQIQALATHEHEDRNRMREESGPES